MARTNAITTATLCDMVPCLDKKGMMKVSTGRCHPALPAALSYVPTQCKRHMWQSERSLTARAAPHYEHALIAKWSQRLANADMSL